MFKSKKVLYITNVFLLSVLFFSIGVNQVIAYRINKVIGARSIIEQIVNISFSGTSVNGIKLTGKIMDDAIKLVISQGIPPVYGAEMAITFDQAQAAIDVMKKYDPTYGKEKIILSGESLNRFIDIGLRISCEYCCGAASIINKDGTGACGCAHSQAMRGLMAYLIQNHGDEYSNDQILRELARWKGIYFPKQMIKKLSEQFQGGNYTPDTASLLIDMKLPDYGGDGNNAPLPSEIDNLPSMVGGC